MFKRIKIKIVVFLIPVIVFTLISTYYVNIKIGRDIIEKEITDKMTSLDTLKKNEVESFVDEVGLISSTVSSMVSTTYKTTDFEDYEAVLSSIMSTSTRIDGIAIILEPYALGENINYSATYAQKTTDGKITSNTNFSRGTYNFYVGENYSLAKSSDGLEFTKPIKDDLTKENIIVSSYPIKDENGNFMGSVSVKLKLDNLAKKLNAFSVDKSKVYLVDDNGEFLVHDNSQLLKDGYNISDIENTTLSDESLQKIFDENSGFFKYIDDGVVMNAYFTTITKFDWKMIHVISDDNLNMSLNRAKPYFISITILSILFLIIIITLLIKRSVETPIKIVLSEFDKISSNKYTLEVPELLAKRNDEFGLLGSELSIMKNRLKEYQTNLEDAVNKNLSAAEEMKVQNDALIESENMLVETLNYNNAILSAIPDLLFVITLDGTILDVQGVNTSFFSDSPDYIGRNFKDFILEKSKQNEILDKIKLVSENHSIESTEITINHDGEDHHFDFRFSDCNNGSIMVIARNLSEVKNQLIKINHLSNFDQLTGLYNRRNLRKFANEVLSENTYPFCMVVTDLNGVKLVNSSYGFAVGDIYIEEYAKILSTFGLEETCLGYFGGGEFCIILKNADESDAERFIKSVKEECKNHFVRDISISAAFGYYCVKDQHITIDYAVNIAEQLLVENKKSEFSNTHINTIEIINRTLQAKSPREQFHSDRVANLSKKFAKVYGLSEKDQNDMHTAGLLHDIGKIGIPENILDKPGKLTDGEFHELRRHPEIGFKILEASGDMKDIANIIVSHHERWDGNGYPQNLKGDEIPLQSRMITIIDAFDAMVSDRSYRSGMSQEDAVAELIRCKGTQFDAELVDLFIAKVL